MTDLVEKIRYHIAIRGGPVKDDDGNYVGTTWPMLLEAADEIERLRTAIAPFAADKLPSSRRTEIAYNRDGLRCAMSPLQIAQTAALHALGSSGERGK